MEFIQREENYIDPGITPLTIIDLKIDEIWSYQIFRKHVLYEFHMLIICWMMQPYEYKSFC